MDRGAGQWSKDSGARTVEQGQSVEQGQWSMWFFSPQLFSPKRIGTLLHFPSRLSNSGNERVGASYPIKRMIETNLSRTEEGNREDLTPSDYYGKYEVGLPLVRTFVNANFLAGSYV